MKHSVHSTGGNFRNRLRHGCEGRIDDVGQKNIVHADDGQIAGNRQVIVAAFLVDAVCDHVVEGENGRDILSQQAGQGFLPARDGQGIAKKQAGIGCQAIFLKGHAVPQVTAGIDVQPDGA